MDIVKDGTFYRTYERFPPIYAIESEPMRSQSYWKLTVSFQKKTIRLINSIWQAQTLSIVWVENDMFIIFFLLSQRPPQKCIPAMFYSTPPSQSIELKKHFFFHIHLLAQLEVQQKQKRVKWTIQVGLMRMSNIKSNWLVLWLVIVSGESEVEGEVGPSSPTDPLTIKTFSITHSSFYLPGKLDIFRSRQQYLLGPFLGGR